MKRNWDINELIEHWTLLPAEMSLLNNKTGANRLGNAFMLKFFQQKAKFPNSAPEIPAVVVNYVARLVEVPPEQYREYDWLGRTGWHHRTQSARFLWIPPRHRRGCPSIGRVAHRERPAPLPGYQIFGKCSSRANALAAD